MATIKVDLDRINGEIDKRMFGGFAEHIGRVVYEGIFEPASKLSDSDGFRCDVMDAVKKISPGTLRWPGGNFASAYDWRKAIGPVGERRPVIEPVWKSVESNLFGTDEFVKYCRKIGAEPYICVNLGDGTQREAMHWLEYCNAKTGTSMADLRAKNGSDEPFGVKYWGLGNEICGNWQIGHKDAKTYAADALEFAKVMRQIDPDIELIAAGGIHMRMGFDQIERNWDRVILEKLAGVIDHVGLHFYARKLPVSPDEEVKFRDFMSEPEWFEDTVSILRGEIDKAMYHMSEKEKRDIKITVDELGIWYKGFDQIYNLEDVLVAGGLLNTILNNADIVSFFNYAQIANVIGPIFTKDDDLFLQTIYYPLELYARLASGNALDLFVNAPTFDTEFRKGLPLLHASASHDRETGVMTLFVVNRDPSSDIEADIINQNGYWPKKCEVHEINGPTLDAENSFENKTNICIMSKEVEIDPETTSFSYSFPAHSITALTLTLNG